MLCFFFGVKKSGISVFLVSVKNGAGVNKMTNITYAETLDFRMYAPGVWSKKVPFRCSQIACHIFGPISNCIAQTGSHTKIHRPLPAGWR